MKRQQLNGFYFNFLLLIMTYNATKSISRWSEIHTKFALKNGIKNVASHLWKWILSQGKEGHEIEFNLKDFQKYVAKFQGEPFTFWYVKTKLHFLASLRIIHIDKAFGSNWYRIHLRHPSVIEPKKAVTKKLTKPIKICDLQPSNGDNSDSGLYSSSNSINPTPHEKWERYEKLKLCGEYGIYFDPNKVTTEKLFEYGEGEIDLSLQLFKKRGGHSKTRDPQAWLMSCLVNEYWNEDNYNSADFWADLNNMLSNIPIP